MAATKSNTVLHNNATLTAGAGDTNSSFVDLSTAYGAVAMIRLTNGATGPTVPAQVKVQIAGDGGTEYYELLTVKGGTSNSEIAPFVVLIPAEAKGFRTVSGSNTGQNVTLRVEYTLLTGV